MSMENDGDAGGQQASDPRILAFAYGCVPGQGSEHGAGWAWARLVAGVGPTCVLTRPWPGAVDAIRSQLPTIPEAGRLDFVFVDLPRWIRPLVNERSGPRLQRIAYLLWLAEALRTARRLQRRTPYDLVWHLTWANIWIGTTAALVGPPLILGPVGGGVGPPWRLVPMLGARGALFELARAVARAAGRYLNPLARLSWSRAKLILVQNPETLRWLPASARERAVVFPNAVLEEAMGGGARRQRSPLSTPTALFAGRLVPWKGAELAIRAIALLPDWRLIVCGDGPDERRLRRLSQELGVETRVELRGLVPRAEILRLMGEDADVLLFPSLHDEGSWVVAESVASGLPVVCLDHGGPRVLGGTPVRAGTPSATVAALARAVRECDASPPRPAEPMDLETRRTRLMELLRRTGVAASGAGDAGDAARE